MYYKNVSKASLKDTGTRSKNVEETYENFEIVIENVETSEVKCFKTEEHGYEKTPTLPEKNNDNNDNEDFLLEQLFKENQDYQTGGSGQENKDKIVYSSCVDTDLDRLYDFSEGGASRTFSSASSHSSKNGIEMPVFKTEIDDIDYNDTDLFETNGRATKGSFIEEMTKSESTESSLWDLATGYDFSVPVKDMVKTEPVSDNKYQNSDFETLENTFDFSDIKIKEESIQSIRDEDSFFTNNLLDHAAKTAAYDDCDGQLNKSCSSHDKINLCSNDTCGLNDTLNSAGDRKKSDLKEWYRSFKSCNLTSCAVEEGLKSKTDGTNCVKTDPVTENVFRDARNGKPGLCNVKRCSFPCLPRSSTFPNLTSAIRNVVNCTKNLKKHTQSSNSPSTLSGGDIEQNAKTVNSFETKGRSLWKPVDASPASVYTTSSKIRFTLKKHHPVHSTMKPLRLNTDTNLEDNMSSSEKLTPVDIRRNDQEKVWNLSSLLATRQKCVKTNLRSEDGVEDDRFSETKNTTQTLLCLRKDAFESKKEISFLDDDLSIGNLKINDEPCTIGKLVENKENNADMNSVDYNYVMLDGIMSLSLNGCESSDSGRNSQLNQDQNFKENSDFTDCKDNLKSKIPCSISSSADGTSGTTKGEEVESSLLTVISVEQLRTTGDPLDSENIQVKISEEGRRGSDVDLNEPDKLCNIRMKVQNSAESHTTNCKQEFEPGNLPENPKMSFDSEVEDIVKYNKCSNDLTDSVNNEVREVFEGNRTLLKLENRNIVSVPPECIADDDVGVSSKGLKLRLSIPKSVVNQNNQSTERSELESVNKFETKHFSNCDDMTSNEYECENDSGEDNEWVTCDSYRIIKRYYMDRCTGSTLQKLVLRVKERKTYTDHELDDDEIEGKRSYKIEDKLKSDKYNKDYVKKLAGEEFNLRYLQENGLQYPIVFAEKNGLGLRVPSDNFKVADVKACVGSRRMLDVMDVTTQKGLEMTMKEWTRYYENTERDRLLNVISLEFSHTRLENYVESPNLVREIDWVDTAWPQHLKDCQTESTNAIDKMKYPKVQKYCLMSVAGCYTDFHIDFGGTSVWYHILHGEKIFWLIPPTDKNLAKYENWVLSGKQGDAFLADSIEECQMIRLVAGNTFIIPSGWIHAVFTPKDSLVFGGNFLHSFNMVNQLRVAAIEDKTHVPMKFRYPFYAEINWYVLERYVHSLTGVTYLEKPQLNEDLEVISSKVERDQSNFEMLEEKLSKRLSVSLTRIDDTSPRRKSTSDDDSTASGPTRSPGQASTLPRTGRKSSSESANSLELKSSEKPEVIKVPYKSPVKKKTKYVHLTKYELEGLIEVVGWVESLPPSKKGVPKDLIDADAVLREIKRLIQEHMKDNPELAITGEPVLEWTKATKKLIKLKQKAKTAKLLGTHCGPKVKASGGKNASGNRHRRVRCKKCEPCTRDDCMECNFCKDMRKYGGPGRAKQSCISRQCLAPILPKGIQCQICKLYHCMLDKPVKTDGAVDDEAEDYSSSLMECGICWEIVHPLCQRKKYENLNNDGVLNEDLPNSWKCSKCCFDGKEGKLMARVFKGGWRPNPTSTPPPLSISPPPQAQSPGIIVTEGKRVTLNPMMDSKKTVMPKLSPSPEHREIDSKLNVSASIDTVYTFSDAQSMTPPRLKTEISDPVKTNGVKMEVADTFPVRSHDIKMEVTDSLPVKKTDSAEEPVKSYSKRSSSPLEENPFKKKRNVSPSPSRSAKFSRASGQTKTTPSTGSKPGKSPSVETATKRSKREITQRSATRCTYDFEDEEFMDVSVPMPEKGKGKSFKGRKNLHLKNKDFGANLGSNINRKSHTQTVEQKSEEQSHMLKKSSEKLCSDQLKQTLIAHIERRNLPIIKPRFVVRPAPISPPDDYCVMVNGQKHPLSRKLWTCIFIFLPSADLARCQAVCQTWNRWCINPDLWTKIDLSKKRIVQTHLMGIVRRQPEYLDLSAVIMTQKQILWLLERIPLLKTLIVSKCSWATISGLCMSACPLLHKLDVSWATGLNDKCFEDLISPPVDRKPGVKNISRLHRLKSIHLSGTEITDTSLELMTLHLSQLEELNVSYCTRITDRGIQILASSKSATQDSLKVLNIAGCRGLTEVSLDAIKNFSKLRELYAVNCIRIPAERCRSLRHPRLHTFRY